MGMFSLEKLFGVTIRESATDGSDFTNPDADYRRLFLGEDGQLHVKDSAGAVTGIGGTPAEIVDIPTAEMDDSLVLAPDGMGGVEFRAEAGGGGGTLVTLPIIPPLSAASEGGYTVSADEELSGAPAYGAFCRSPGITNSAGQNGWLSNGGALPHYLRIHLPTALVATQYEVMPWWVDNYPARSILTWTFEGSNNGSSWTTLDTQTSFSSWVANVLPVLFTFSNTTAYSYYQINVSVNGGNGYTGIGYLGIRGPVRISQT